MLDQKMGIKVRVYHGLIVEANEIKMGSCKYFKNVFFATLWIKSKDLKKRMICTTNMLIRPFVKLIIFK
ncbi:hypothetical protein Mgra_00003014 [Meloidogyne graminicola]|uniref:Uncharacterized protein n=1 Tax=Meloidogyne graminicola TaxID=189291 RepID=A0A8S9ZW89_9BILA|nr:hypothetical protein Mgra_00003014 [Meloidogyne graminicola]